MKFALIHRITLFALALTGVLPLIISGEIGFFLGPVFGLCALIGWFLPESLMKKPVYRNLATALLAALFIVQCARILTGEHLAVATIEFSVLILAVKLCMRSEYGDFQQIVLMSFIALIASTVTSYNVSYGLFFIIFVFLSPLAMFLTQMRKEMEVRFTRADGAMRQRLFNSSRIVTGKNIGVPLLGAVLLIISISLIFALIPRWGIGAGGGILPGNQLFGFTDEVKIGDLSQTMEKKDVFIRLWPKDTEANRPATLNIKFRGQVFDTWRDGTWHASGGNRFRYFTTPNGIYALHSIPAGSVAEYTIMQASTDPPYLFLPTYSQVIFVNEVRRRGRTEYPRLEANSESVFKYQDRRKVGIRYSVAVGNTPYAALDAPEFERNLQLPGNTARIGNLARQWTRGARTPADQIQLIVQHFQREFGYTKTVTAMERAGASEDGMINRFLFEYRKGTCEHFATAGVLMFRALDIPARFVTGFQSAKWNSVGDYYTVDASNAHAWTEVYINGRWHTVDPTPQLAGGRRDNSSSLAYWNQLLDTIAMRWHEYVIDYNETTQSNLMTTMLPKKNSTGGARVTFSQKYIGLVALLALVAFAFAKRRQLRQLPRLFRKKTPPSVSAATALYLRLERKLTHQIGPRKSHQTPGQYLRIAAKNLPGAASFIEDFSAAYHQERFGGKPMSPLRRRQLLERMRRIGPAERL